MTSPIVAQSQTSQTEELRLRIEQRIAGALAALWPANLPMPPALAALQDAVVDLATLAGCDEQNRERACKRLLRRYSVEPAGWQGDSSLLQPANVLVAPAVLAALTGDTSDLEPAGYAAAVEAWLAGAQ